MLGGQVVVVKVVEQAAVVVFPYVGQGLAVHLLQYIKYKYIYLPYSQSPLYNDQLILQLYYHQHSFNNKQLQPLQILKYNEAASLTERSKHLLTSLIPLFPI